MHSIAIKLGTACVLGSILAYSPAFAQDQAATPSPDDVSYEDIQAMIDRMHKRVEAMTSAASQRDEALEFLEEQIDKATGRLSGTEEVNEALKQEQAVLAVEIEGLSEEREQLATEVDEREELLSSLEQQVATLTSLLGNEKDDKSSLQLTLGEREKELARLTSERNDISSRLAALEAERNEQTAEIARLTEASDSERNELLNRAEAAEIANQQLEEQVAALTSASDEEQQQLALTIEEQRQELEQRDQQIATLQAKAESEIGEVAAANDKVRILTRQLLELNSQLADVEQLLQFSEDRVLQQQTTIASLGERLNTALAAQVEELSEYRSEFFGRLKQALGDSPEFRIVGDRFVFQSEVLFNSGSASLDPQGRQELAQLATTLKEVAQKIPPELDWILRVDGHTDRVPISSAQFASNWELATARAISVVQELIRSGIPPERLAATGFGEFQPLDRRDDEVAYRRNRRIEFKLTSG